MLNILQMSGSTSMICLWRSCTHPRQHLFSHVRMFSRVQSVISRKENVLLRDSLLCLRLSLNPLISNQALYHFATALLPTGMELVYWYSGYKSNCKKKIFLFYNFWSVTQTGNKLQPNIAALVALQFFRVSRQWSIAWG